MPANDDVAQHLAYALQLVLGGVFLLSVLPKLRRPRSFAATVTRYELLPVALSRVVALAVAAVEALLAVCFLTGWLIGIALPVAGAVLVGFGCATAINLRRGRDIPCGCFGSASERILTSRRSIRLALG